MRVRRRGFTGSFVLLSLIVAAVVSLGLPAARALPAAEKAAPLRVMSFNIRYGTAPDGENAWEHRRDLLLETIVTFDPDLLGTQECLQLQAEFLQARLPGRSFVGVGRDDGRQAGEMCAIFYRSDRFEQLDAGHFWLSETPDEVASKSWDAALTRIVSWVRLRDKVSAQPLVFFNTHFDHMGQAARRESAGLLLQKVREIAGDLPRIVTGDFNADADPITDGPYRVLLGVARKPGRGSSGGPGGESGPPPLGLTDTYRAVHPRRAAGEGTFNGFTGDASGQRIDWILTSPGWKVLEAGIDRTQRDGRYPSDHFPVTAVVSF